MSLKIKVFSPNKSNLRVFKHLFVLNFKKTQICDYSIFELPNQESKITVLKSPFVHKKARTQFKESNYSMIIVISLKEKKNIVVLSFLKYFFTTINNIFKENIGYKLEINY